MSHVTAFNWIKAYGKKLDEIRSSDAIEVIEIDEMHTYIGSKKNYCWRWIAVDRDGRKFIHCGVGTRGTETGEKLWKKIEPKIKGKVCTAYWKAYEAFVPEYTYTIQSGTFMVEGYNSLFRHFLARLRRKTRCYSKVVYMLVYSVKLLVFKWNNDLSILF